MAQTAAELQRSQGELRVRIRRLGDRSVLGDLYQQGCLKARLPRHGPEQTLEVVTINTAGGLTDGDDVRTAIRWDAGTRGVVTTQAAERLYHCRQGPARINTTLNIASNAIACWLPQETILFDRSRLERQTSIELSSGATLFAVESLVFGRTAMQEVVKTGAIFDRLQLRRDGKLILADALQLDGDGMHSIDAQLGKKVVLDAAKCCATVVFANDDVPAILEQLRAIIAERPIVGGASDLGGVIIARLIANDSKAMREVVLQLYMACLTPFDFSVPRVWYC